MKYKILALACFLIPLSLYLFTGPLKAAKKLDQHPPLWMKEQITSDLAPFQRLKIKTADLDAIMEEAKREGNKNLLVRYKIQNQEVLVDLGQIERTDSLARTSWMTEALHTLTTMTTVPDVDFIVSMHDTLEGTDFSLPVFSFALDPAYTSNIVLIPDPEALIGSKRSLAETKKGNRRYPWKSKIEQVIWRGAMTGQLLSDDLSYSPERGVLFSSENFLYFPRTKAISLSLQFPLLIDARYTALTQCTDGTAIQAQYRDYFGDHMAIKKHIQYKYQLLVDGNTAAYSRAYWQLFSNSVIFKQNSNAVQWYSRALKPYVHYIPIQTDLSDLVERVKWAKDHDKEARQISLRAQEFARGHLTHFHVMQYLSLLLTEYAQLQE